MDNAKPAVEVRNITIQFGALKANRDVSFSVKEKEFFGLIGPNGAGKTTMFNAMTGGVVPVEGDILFNGTSVLKKRPDQICHIGISRTYQNIRLFSQMTVEENVEIGLHAVPQYSRLAAFLGLPVVKKVERESKERAGELLNRFGLFSQKDMKAGSLPYAMQRKLEIARALATKPKFLLLDEPAAGMNNDECNELVELLKGVHKDFDLTTILIEHHIDLVVNLCDRLCNGTSVLKKRPDQICHIGISRTYQNIRLFSQMTVEENVEIGLHAVPQYSRLAAFLGLPVVKKVERESKERAGELLNRFGLFSQKDMKAGSLPYAMQRKLEIARALATKPKFLLLDEPAAGMNNDECNELVELLKGVHKDFDLTTILIEHHIDLVVNLCDRLCVLNLGEVLAQGEPEKVQTNPDVIKAYLGDRRQWIDNE